jgi:PEP-CTERM motif
MKSGCGTATKRCSPRPFVGAGIAGILDSGFRFTDIAPVLLTAGQTYYVAAVFSGPGDDNFVHDPTSLLTAPQITYDSRRFVPATVLTFPGSVGSPTFTTGYWGGNVRLDAVQPVPEPTTMVLLGSGLAAAFVRRRRR